MLAAVWDVDIKRVGKRFYVIEINDNPNVGAGNEDSVLKDVFYREVIGVFLKRIEARKRGAPPMSDTLSCIPSRHS